MGLTWIVGVLIVEVPQLLPLAYIYTIMVAFQGVFIFVIFVPFSKQVKEAYSKWWRVKVSESDILSKYFGDKVLKSSSVSKVTGSKQADSNSTIPRKVDTPPLPALTITPAPAHSPPPVVVSPVRSLAEVPIHGLPDEQQQNRTSSLSSPRPKSRHWSTLKRKLDEGSLFQVVYSPTYFDPTTETSDNPNGQETVT